MAESYRQKTKWGKKENRKPTWYLLDAQGKTLGRFASEVAKILKGKHTPMYTPNVDCGDYVIVINAAKVVVTGSKEAQKEYRHHTGWMGGLRRIGFRRMRDTHPERIIERAVKGMIPRTRLGRAQFKKLRVFSGESHNMQAQQPITVNI